MFDIGWSELLVIAVVLIVVVGPKDLPPMIRAFGKMTARARKVAGEFRAQFDEALREADMDEVRQTLADAQKLNPVNTLREAMNPLRQMGNEIKADLQRSTMVDAPASTPAVAAPEPAFGLGETPAVAQPLATPADAMISNAVPLTATPAPIAGDPAIAKPKAVRKPRAKATATAVAKPAAAAAAAPVVASAPVEKPKRASTRKTAAPAKVAVETPPVAARKKRTASKKDDA